MASLGSNTRAVRQPLLGLAVQRPQKEEEEDVKAEIHRPASASELIADVRNRISVTGSERVTGAELPRSFTTGAFFDKDQEDQAREEVLSDPEKMRDVANSVGKDRWLSMPWSERLQRISSYSPPPPPPQEVPCEPPPPAPTPALQDTQSIQPPAPSNHSLSPQTPVAAVPPPSASERRSLKKSSSSKKLRRPRSSRKGKHQMHQQQQRRETELQRIRDEIEGALHDAVPKGVLKKFQSERDIKYMNLLDAQCNQLKKRRKRVVIIEPGQMVVAHPKTGNLLRQIALDKLAAIDYQDKEYGRSVVMRFDGEADAAFVQNSRTLLGHEEDEDELMSTTVKMAKGFRELKGLPPRPIRPFRYPLYRDLLASAQTEASHDPPSNPATPRKVPQTHSGFGSDAELAELAAWEDRVETRGKKQQKQQLPQPVPMISASPPPPPPPSPPHPPRRATQPQQPSPQGAEKLATPNNTLRSSNPTPAMPPAPAPSPAKVQEEEGEEKPSYRGGKPAARVAPKKGGETEEDGWLEPQLLWKVRHDTRVRSLLMKAAGVVRTARGGGPDEESLISGLVQRAKSEPSVRRLLESAVAAANTPPLPAAPAASLNATAVASPLPSPSPPSPPAEARREATRRELLACLEHPQEKTPQQLALLRERLLRHYSNLSPEDQQIFEDVAFGLREEQQHCRPSARSMVIEHTISPPGFGQTCTLPGSPNVPSPQRRRTAGASGYW